MMSPYLQRIRSLVGNELLILPSVTILVFDHEGRVLLAKHRDTGRWVAPGGMVEPDESPAEAALREMREETGCEVQLLEILGVFGGPKFRVRYRNGDEVACVMTVYKAKIEHGLPAPNGQETVELEFVAPGEVASLNAAAWLTEVLGSLVRGQSDVSARAR